MADAKQAPKPQIEKFREMSKELEADEDEEAFDEKLKRIAKSTPSPKEAPNNH